jgi:hypothetical protein
MIQAASQISYGQSVTVIIPQPNTTTPKLLAGSCIGWDSTNRHVLVQWGDGSSEYIPVSQIQ